MLSFAAKKVIGGAVDKAKDQHDKAGGVNWQEFNWPPCLTVVHFDPRADPIPALARDTVLFMRNMLFGAMAILVFNICSNIGFVASSNVAGIVIFYSCMQFAVGSIAGGVVLFTGYRGIAGDLARSSRIYLIAQGLLTVMMLVFSGLDSGNLHGFAGITAHENDRPQPAYKVLCVIEGLAWLACAVVSIVAMYKVYRYPGHERAARDATAAEKATASAAAARDSKARRSKRSRRERDGGEGAEGGEDINSSAGSINKSGRSKKGKKPRRPDPEDEV